jgi:hypothetical protein
MRLKNQFSTDFKVNTAGSNAPLYQILKKIFRGAVGLYYQNLDQAFEELCRQKNQNVIRILTDRAYLTRPNYQAPGIVLGLYDNIPSNVLKCLEQYTVLFKDIHYTRCKLTKIMGTRNPAEARSYMPEVLITFFPQLTDAEVLPKEASVKRFEELILEYLAMNIIMDNSYDYVFADE